MYSYLLCQNDIEHKLLHLSNFSKAFLLTKSVVVLADGELGVGNGADCGSTGELVLTVILQG